MRSPFLLSYLSPQAQEALAPEAQNLQYTVAEGLPFGRLHGKEGSSLTWGNLTKVSTLQTLFSEVLSGGQSVGTQLSSQKWKHQGLYGVGTSPLLQTV